MLVWLLWAGGEWIGRPAGAGEDMMDLSTNNYESEQ